MKEIRADLKQLWHDLKKIYPASFNWLTARWKVTLACFFLIITSFYFDGVFKSLFYHIHSNIFDIVFGFGRWFGNGEPTLILFLILYFGGLYISNYKVRDTGLLIGEAYIFSGFLTLLFKSAVGRWRPYMEKGEFAFNGWSWTNNDQFSFFSGHAQVSFAISVVLALTTKNVYLKSFYYSLAVITAFSRIYHNQHWLSDIVIGSMVSILISSLLVRFHKNKFKDIHTQVVLQRSPVGPSEKES